jgi:GAF domain-containing protein
MKRRSGAGGKPARPRVPKRSAPKGGNAPKAARNRGVSVAGQETVVARLTHERDEALLRETANSEILRLISKSPDDLELVFRTILENATRICNANFGTLYRFDGENIYPVAQFNTPAALLEAQTRRGPFPPMPGTAIGQSMRTKQVIHIADGAAEPIRGLAAKLGGARSLVAVPMLKDDALIGGILIYRQEVRPFTDKQIELLQNFAAQAVIAIENTRLLNELRQSLEQQTATADILRVIASTPEDSKRALDTIAETASRMFGVANVNFRRIEGDVLRIVSSAGPTIERLRKALPDISLEPTDPAVRCFLDNRQIPVEDRRAVLANERGAIAAALRELPVRSQVFTPLSRQGKAIGVMIVTRGEVQPFQQGDLDLMKGFADQAVIAIENARLLSELRESYRLVQQQAGKLEAQSQELVKLNQQLEQRVADQVGEIERMGRLRRFLPPQVA